jgi:ABC-type transport system involved in cytochrome bd biosynthesis fused ATPase/permease subunit
MFQANAHDFIMEFPEGYDTPVGASKSNTGLSGGQKQRYVSTTEFKRRRTQSVLRFTNFCLRIGLRSLELWSANLVF